MKSISRTTKQCTVRSSAGLSQQYFRGPVVVLTPEGKRTRSAAGCALLRGCPLSTPPCSIPEPLSEMAARLVSLAVLVCDCSALLLGASTPRHSMAQDTVARRSATVQMDLSSLVCDNPLAAIAVSSAAGTALGVLVSRALPTASIAGREEVKPKFDGIEVRCFHGLGLRASRHGLSALACGHSRHGPGALACGNPRHGPVMCL